MKQLYSFFRSILLIKLKLKERQLESQNNASNFELLRLKLTIIERE